MSFVLFVKPLMKFVHTYCMNVPWFKLCGLIFNNICYLFTLSIIVCNNVLSAPKHGINSLVLMIKYYIFCPKCSQTIANIPTAWQYIYKLVNIEKYIVTYHVMLDEFNQKWFFCIMNIIHVYVAL